MALSAEPRKGVLPEGKVSLPENVKELPWVIVESELCKGCDFCVVTCPPEVLEMSADINRRGYRFSFYKGEGCTGCGICYYNCPEPGAITVYRKPTDKKEKKVLE
jgi:NAD-dependent dihydropyrimidine dehydrogenase PreA subunit